MKILATALVALPLALAGANALAADHAAGAAKAEMCLDCHMNDDFAGMSAAEIEGQIRAAQAGEIKHAAEIKDLAEEDIAVVAAWFAHEGGQ
jgi:cytochrome c553